MRPPPIPTTSRDSAVALRERGNAAFRGGDLVEAEQLFLAALHLDETDAKASANLSAIYLKRKNYVDTFS